MVQAQCKSAVVAAVLRPAYFAAWKPTPA